MSETELLLRELFKSLPVQRLFFDFRLDSLSTFNAGGPADVLFLPESNQEIQTAVGICQKNEIPVQVLGRGSNILISDRGIRGLTIYLGRNFTRISQAGNIIKAQSGASLAALNAMAAKSNLSGLEFCTGIPGSVGGAILMNASSYDGETKNVVFSSRYLSAEGEIKTLSLNEHQFGYRTSVYNNLPSVILEAEYKLKPGKRLEIYGKIQEFQIKRRNSQPIDKQSAGSAFKRPPGNYASKLIADAGLKGYRAGNAGVSAKHAGFIINYGGATASEINKVFEYVHNVVRDKFDVNLEPEVKWIGEWSEEEIQWKSS